MDSAAARSSSWTRIGLCVAGLLLLSAALASCGRGHPAPPETRRELSLTVNGAEYAADVYLPRSSNPPGLLLLPRPGGVRTDWAAFAVRAQHEGYLCLAVDAPEYAGRESASADELRAVLEEAFRRLPRLGAEPDHLGVIGVEASADFSLRFAAENDAVQALALVSPGSVLEGDEAAELVRIYGRRPLFLLTTSGDAFSAETARRLRAASPGLAELREYAGSASGTDIFAVSDNAAEQLLNWLNLVLPPPPQGDE